MSEVQRIGTTWGGPGDAAPFSATLSGAQRVTDAHARYMDAILSNRVFMLSVNAATPTAYAGAAGGTPLLGIHNPTGSGKYAVPLFATVASNVASSAAGTVEIDMYGGQSVIPGGTVATPRNALSLIASGSAMVGVSNAAMTNSSALTFLGALASYYWATAAAAFMAPGWFDLAGIGTVQPGSQFMLGANAALTSAKWSVSIFWEEIPYIVLPS